MGKLNWKTDERWNDERHLEVLAGPNRVAQISPTFANANLSTETPDGWWAAVFYDFVGDAPYGMKMKTLPTQSEAVEFCETHICTASLQQAA